VFADLLHQPGVREVVELRSTFGFLAFHGGSLEQMTAEIAGDAAERAGASLYAVIQPADLRWHVPSRLVDPAASEGLAAFLDHVDLAVAVHGYGRAARWTDILLGGANRGLAARLGIALQAALPDYQVVHVIDDVPPELRGLNPDNPVNRPRGGGVQLELPPRVRGMGPKWADWSGPGWAPPTEALIAALAAFADLSDSNSDATYPDNAYQRRCGVDDPLLHGPGPAAAGRGAPGQPPG
jgi:phage replication-related protein YjqB (UPF0714/DUF867 family)